MLIKLEWLGYRMVKKLWRYVKPFSSDTGTSQTRQTELLYQYRASVCWCSIKIQYQKTCRCVMQFDTDFFLVPKSGTGQSTALLREGNRHGFSGTSFWIVCHGPYKWLRLISIVLQQQRNSANIIIFLSNNNNKQIQPLRYALTHL